MPKRATEEPADPTGGPENEDGAKRNGDLHDKPRLRRPDWRTVYRCSQFAPGIRISGDGQQPVPGADTSPAPH